MDDIFFIVASSKCPNFSSNAGFLCNSSGNTFARQPKELYFLPIKILAGLLTTSFSIGDA